MNATEENGGILGAFSGLETMHNNAWERLQKETDACKDYRKKAFLEEFLVNPRINPFFLSGIDEWEACTCKKCSRYALKATKSKVIYFDKTLTVHIKSRMAVICTKCEMKSSYTDKTYKSSDRAGLAFSEIFSKRGPFSLNRNCSYGSIPDALIKKHLKIDPDTHWVLRASFGSPEPWVMSKKDAIYIITQELVSYINGNEK